MLNYFLSLDVFLHELIIFPYRYLRTMLIFVSSSKKSEYFNIHKALLESNDKDMYFKLIRELNYITPPSFGIVTILLISVVFHQFFLIIGAPLLFFPPKNFSSDYFLRGDTNGLLLSSYVAMFIVTCILAVAHRIKIGTYRIFNLKAYNGTPVYLRSSFFNQCIAFQLYISFCIPLVYFFLSFLLLFFTLFPEIKEMKNNVEILITVGLIINVQYMIVISAFEKYIFGHEAKRFAFLNKISHILFLFLKTTFLKFYPLFILFIITTKIIQIFAHPDLVQEMRSMEFMKSQYSLSDKLFADGKQRDYCKLCDFKEIGQKSAPFQYGNLAVLNNSEKADSRIIYNSFMGLTYLCKTYELLYCPPEPDFNEKYQDDFKDFLIDNFGLWSSGDIMCKVTVNSLITRTRKMRIDIEGNTKLNAPKYFLDESERYFVKAKNEIDAGSMQEFSCIYPETNSDH